MPDASRPNSAVDAVDADRADRIVDADLVEEEDAPDDQHAGDGADDERRPRRDERARAVIATRPASMPLHIIEGSGFLPEWMHHMYRH